MMKDNGKKMTDFEKLRYLRTNADVGNACDLMSDVFGKMLEVIKEYAPWRGDEEWAGYTLHRYVGWFLAYMGIIGYDVDFGRIESFYEEHIEQEYDIAKLSEELAKEVLEHDGF